MSTTAENLMALSGRITMNPPPDYLTRANLAYLSGDSVMARMWTALALTSPPKPQERPKQDAQKLRQALKDSHNPWGES